MGRGVGGGWGQGCRLGVGVGMKAGAKVWVWGGPVGGTHARVDLRRSHNPPPPRLLLLQPPVPRGTEHTRRKTTGTKYRKKIAPHKFQVVRHQKRGCSSKGS